MLMKADKSPAQQSSAGLDSGPFTSAKHRRDEAEHVQLVVLQRMSCASSALQSLASHLVECNRGNTGADCTSPKSRLS